MPDEPIDWDQAQEWYELVFREFREAREPQVAVPPVVPVNSLRVLYTICTYIVGRRSRREGSLDDVAAIAWKRLIDHWMKSNIPYVNFKTNVFIHVRSALIDDYRRRNSHKNNEGVEPLPYDESEEDSPEPGIVRAQSAPPVESSGNDAFEVLSEALNQLVQSKRITERQREAFLDFFDLGIPVTQIARKQKTSTATIYSWVAVVRRHVKEFLTNRYNE